MSKRSGASRRERKRTRKLTRKRTRELYTNAGRKIPHQQEKNLLIMPVFQRGKRQNLLGRVGPRGLGVWSRVLVSALVWSGPRGLGVWSRVLVSALVWSGPRGLVSGWSWLSCWI